MSMHPVGPRSIAFIGPYLSGKSTLLESILYVSGTLSRKGRMEDGTTVADSAPEARERHMSTEVTAASFEYLGEHFTLLDCPGSIEFLQETYDILSGVDAAVVVCEPDSAKILSLSPLLHYLEKWKIPHFIFVNKIDKASGSLHDLLSLLQPLSTLPLILRQIPIRSSDAEITGYVDLASERAYIYRNDAPSTQVALPEAIQSEEKSERFAMLEKLADFDDRLMEALLEDRNPDYSSVFSDLSTDLQKGLIVPVLIGAAATDHGVRRLLKALRHEVPNNQITAERCGIIQQQTTPIVQVIKTYHAGASGKLSLARIWSGALKDGQILNGDRVGGIFRLRGAEHQKIGEAKAGEIVALARLDQARTGDFLSTHKLNLSPQLMPIRLKPVYSLAIATKNRNDEVKLSTALAKLTEEDRSLIFEQNPITREFLLRGQGEIHLKVAFSRLKSRYGLTLKAQRPRISYHEAIRQKIRQHGRFKRQSGGHGQFGDVHLEIKPLPRGSGFRFINKIVGGAVPKNFIPAVEDGVREYLACGPLGFPVVDIEVALCDGSYHSVDSSELAFKMAARTAMSEGMAKCGSVLLEPIGRVKIFCPSEYTSRVNALLSGRRGQILGFDARDGWPTWDQVEAYLPEAELHDLILELRSATQGVGTYRFEWDHLQELSGRLADDVLLHQGDLHQDTTIHS